MLNRVLPAEATKDGSTPGETTGKRTRLGGNVVGASTLKSSSCWIRYFSTQSQYGQVVLMTFHTYSMSHLSKQIQQQFANLHTVCTYLKQTFLYPCASIL